MCRYTGKISSDELAELNDQVVTEGGLEDTYTINDVVGKSGIEAYMETTLQGTKGSEKVVVNNTGKVITILERKEAQPGADVYLTIDKDLTEAVYNIIEQKSPVWWQARSSTPKNSICRRMPRARPLRSRSMTCILP